MLEFHDPRADVGVKLSPYTLGLDLPRQNNAKVACLANGFPDSVAFLEKVGGRATGSRIQ